MVTLRRTCLHQRIVDAGGRMVEFSGWELPVQFSGIIQEHLAVRGKAGLFDVSHMGQIEVHGTGALDLLQRLTCNDVSRLRPGQVQYNVLTTPEGTFVDDLLVSRTGDTEYLLCVNAANEGKDLDWIQAHSQFGASVVNRSSEFALLALQGPRAQGILGKCTEIPLDRLAGFHIVRCEVVGRTALLSRTGYTGEDGFEIYLSPKDAGEVWSRLLETGTGDGLLPAGLGARDTLRLEARLFLYGNDMDETTSLCEAGFRRFVKLEKGDFLGRKILEKQFREGVPRRLVGFEMVETGIPRRDYRLFFDGTAVGRVTSGGPAPFLKKNVGLGYLPTRLAVPGKEIQVEIRGKFRSARVVQGPFYKGPAGRGESDGSGKSTLQ